MKIGIKILNVRNDIESEGEFPTEYLYLNSIKNRLKRKIRKTFMKQKIQTLFFVDFSSKMAKQKKGKFDISLRSFFSEKQYLILALTLVCCC